MAAPMRFSPVDLFVNFLIGTTPGMLFQSPTRRALGHSAVTRFSSAGLSNRRSPSAMGARAFCSDAKAETAPSGLSRKTLVTPLTDLFCGFHDACRTLLGTPHPSLGSCGNATRTQVPGPDTQNARQQTGYRARYERPVLRSVGQVEARWPSKRWGRWPRDPADFRVGLSDRSKIRRRDAVCGRSNKETGGTSGGTPEVKDG